jgi:hypothetical protein
MKKQESNNKWLVILASIILVALIIAVIRFSSPEDDWMCKNGTWVRHGNPSGPSPITLCQK